VDSEYANGGYIEPSDEFVPFMHKCYYETAYSAERLREILDGLLDRLNEGGVD
jgi:hypothetical protein